MGDDFNDVEAGKLMQSVRVLGYAVRDLSNSISDLRGEIKENRTKVVTIENRMNRWIGYTAGSVGMLSFLAVALGLMIKLNLF